MESTLILIMTGNNSEVLKGFSGYFQPITLSTWRYRQPPDAHKLPKGNHLYIHTPSSIGAEVQ
jgi:hypothetical protein